MSTLSIPKTYQDSTTISLAAADLDGIVDTVETFINGGNIDESNLKADSITAAKIAAGTITGSKFSDASITKAKLVPYVFDEGQVPGGPLPSVSVPITTTGGRVLVFIGFKQISGQALQTKTTTTYNVPASAKAILKRDGITIGGTFVTAPAASAGSTNLFTEVRNGCAAIDSPSAGVHTYSVEIDEEADAANVWLSVLELI